MKIHFAQRELLATITIALLVASLAFPLSTQAQQFSVIYTFTGGTDGGTPNGGAREDRKGNFFGTTEFGGLGFGTVYVVKKGKETVLYRFTGSPDGEYPTSDLIMDASGTN